MPDRRYNSVFFKRAVRRHLLVAKRWGTQEGFRELGQAIRIAKSLDWISQSDFSDGDLSVLTGTQEMSSEVGNTQLTDSKLLRPIQKRRLLDGVVFSFLEALKRVSDSHQLENHPGLESLLRNVEVRRQRCLVPAGDKTAKEVCLDKHRVALLFTTVSNRTGDCRFLNAALKLNDWAYPTHRRMRPCYCTATWLYSIALQEQLLFELQR